MSSPQIPAGAWIAVAVVVVAWYLSRKAADAASAVASFAESTRQDAASKVADTIYSVTRPNEIDPTAPVPLKKGADGRWHAVPSVVDAARGAPEAVGVGQAAAVVVDPSDPAFDPTIYQLMGP